jgi:CysZ protein
VTAGPPKSPRPGAAGDFVRGLDGWLRGAAFISNHPRLWTWILVPLLINAVICSALILLGWRQLEPLAPDFASQDWGWFDGLRLFLVPALRVLVLVVTVLASLALTLIVAGVVNSPFYDVLSERVESVVLRREPPPRGLSALLPDALAALLAALQLALREAAFLSLFFLLSFTLVGALLLALAGFWFAGFALADVTLARKRYRARERGAWARRHRGLVLGLGLPVAMIPPLQPFGIVGATLAYLVDEDKT